MRPSATSVCGLNLLDMRYGGLNEYTLTTSVRGLTLLVSAALRY